MAHLTVEERYPDLKEYVDSHFATNVVSFTPPPSELVHKKFHLNNYYGVHSAEFPVETVRENGQVVITGFSDPTPHTDIPHYELQCKLYSTLANYSSGKFPVACNLIVDESGAETIVVPANELGIRNVSANSTVTIYYRKTMM